MNRIFAYGLLGFILLVVGLQADGVWSYPPVQISAQQFEGYFGAFNQDIAISDSGYAVAIWETSDEDGNKVIQSATLPRLGTWSPFVNITSFPSSFSAAPKIAVDAKGNAVAVWFYFDNVSNSRSVYSSFLPFGGTWSTPVQISTTATTGIAVAEVAINDNGDAVAIWQIRSGSNNIIQSARRYATPNFNSASWSAPINVTSAGFNQSTPRLGVDANGNAVAVWQNTTLSVIQTATLYYNSGSWTPPINLSDSSSESQRISVAPSGYAVAIWRRDSTIVESAIYMNNLWTTPKIIASSPNLVTQPLVEMDSDGNAVATWVYVDVAGVMQSAILPYGGIWSDPQTFSAGSIISSTSLGVDSHGNAISIWTFDDLLIGEVVQSAQLNYQSNTWSSPVVISTPFQFTDVGPTSIAVDLSGYAVALWKNDDGEFQWIEAVDFTPAPNPPTIFCGEVCRKGFPLKIKTCWNESTSPFVVSYQIYKCGKLVQTVLANQPHVYVVCARSCSEAAKQITITSKDIEGFESTPKNLVIEKRCGCK